MINDMHKEAAQTICEKVMADRETKEERYRYVVGISGESGSGKSELAHALGSCLKHHHIRVKVIHTDNYYRIQPLLREEWRRNKGFEMIGINEYDWVKIRKTLRDFREEQECMIPCIDLIPEQVDKLITDFSKVDLLIVDGLYAINAKDIDMRVFIDLTYHETKINQIIRMKEAMSEFRLGILEHEHQAVVSLKHLADLVVDKSYQVVTMDEHNSSDQLEMDLPSILYVDDEIINLELLQLTFMNDFKVITAESAEEGLKMLELHPEIHVVISDLKMPVVNGLDFIKVVKQNYKEKVCMLLTGYMESEVMLEGFNKELIFRYLMKPWKVDELKETILEALKR